MLEDSRLARQGKTHKVGVNCASLMGDLYDFGTPGETILQVATDHASWVTNCLGNKSTRHGQAYMLTQPSAATLLSLVLGLRIVIRFQTTVKKF